MAEVGVAVAGEVATSLLAKIKQHICYLFKYKDNLKRLKDAGEDLDAKRNDANRFFHEANSRQRDVSASAVHWKKNVDELHQNAQNIIARNDISCLNLWSFYSLSKHAWKLSQEIDNNVINAPEFGIDFDHPAPKIGPKFNHRGFMDFESRLAVMDKVLEALKDEKVSMCSVCGMGGIGKTTLVHKLIKKVEDDHLFDKVAMVTVSQDVNLEEIQNEIIEQLGLKVDEGTATARASKLNAWLTSNRILLVLDDVWRQLSDEEFEKVGIPLGSKGCKIVLTSRNEDECKKMGSQKTFPIKVLEHGEAWELFRLNAGKCCEDLNLQDMPRKIVDECDGLPIAIVTIATALKDKPESVWNDSLLQLQNSNLQRISGMDRVFSRIQLSYDLLKDEEAQSCFRLCCLYPEDFDVPIEDLVLYGKGLELFENVDTMAQARDRVESIIYNLKKSLLLVDAKEDGYVRMHDILRDFAISICSKDKHPYLLKCGNEMTKWPETKYENYSVISFMFDIIKEHPVDLRCPKLKVLALDFEEGSAGLPIGFFEGMEELKVLVLKVPSLLKPLFVTKKLRTLILKEITSNWYKIEPPKIGDLLGDRNLKNLEILLISSRRRCKDFPMEIRLLCNLRFLYFDIKEFQYMPPGVLSKLVKLEELELPWSFNHWGCKEEGGERVNASLNEIEHLPLTRLKIRVKEGSILGDRLVKNLKRFKVLMGSHNLYINHGDKSSSADLDVVNVDAGNVKMSWISVLLSKSKHLKLGNVRNLRNMDFMQQTAQHNRSPSAFFSQLEILQLRNMFGLKEIWRGPYFSKREAPCFINLIEITIVGCPKLKHVFPLSVATELKQLQIMEISICLEMGEIFYNEEVDDGNQVASGAEWSITPTATLMNSTPNSLTPGLLGKGKQPKNISSHHQIVEENIAKDDGKEVDHAIIILFPQLKQLTLFYIPKLRIFYDGNEAIELPSLQELEIRDCDNMEGLSYGSLIAPKLKEITINSQTNQNWEDVNAIVKEKVRCREEIDGYPW